MRGPLELQVKLLGRLELDELPAVVVAVAVFVVVVAAFVVVVAPELARH